MPDPEGLFTKHQQTIDEAVLAIHQRTFHAHWPEAPSGKIYGEDAQKEGAEPCCFEHVAVRPFRRGGASGSDPEALLAPPLLGHHSAIIPLHELAAADLVLFAAHCAALP